MPIKTNFLELEKLEGHENYNGDIENSNLDKIDATIKNHEDRTRTLEDKINKKDKLTVELKPEKRVVSVTDSFGGACGFEIEGALVQQLFRNGDFSKGKEDWTSQASKSFEISDGKAIVTADGSHKTCTLTTWGAYKRRTKIGERYFLYAKARVRDDVAKEMYVSMWNGSSLSGDVTKVKPKKDTWIDLYDLFTVGKDGMKFGCYVTSRYESEAIAKDKILEVDYVMCFKIEDSDKGLTRSALKAKYIKNSYYKGVLPLRGVAIETVGKNLFDKNKANLKGYYDTNNIFVSSKVDSSTDFIAIKENTTYFQNDGTTQYVNFYDNNFKFLRNEATNKDGVIGRFQSKLGDVYVRLSFRTNQLETYMVTEGSNRFVDYNPYISSKIVLDDTLVKLPNGVSDKIVRENGKTIKYANTNVGRDGEFYKLKDEDFVGLYTGGTNVNLIQLDLTKLSDYKAGTTGIDGFVSVEGFKGETGTLGLDYDLTTSIGKIAIATSQYWLIVSKTDIPDLPTAKTKYIGSKVTYQIATPQTIDLSDKLEPINSYEDYTQFSVSDGVIEGEKATIVTSNDGFTYGFNIVDSPFYPNIETLNYKTVIIDRVLFNGLNIIDLGFLNTNYSYGNQRWTISKSVVEANNIDINHIYVDYATSETNGQANAKIKYNADMSSAVSSNTNALNIVGEQVDKLTKKANEGLIWIEPTLQNSWVNYDSDHIKVAYTKDEKDWVHIRGFIMGGSIGSDVFQLPEGFRPPGVMYRATSSNHAYGEIRITSDGKLRIKVGSPIWVEIGCSFYVGN